MARPHKGNNAKKTKTTKGGKTHGGQDGTPSLDGWGVGTIQPSEILENRPR